ncbi:MAG: dephospho-CoA kinase [Micavibrio sp.]|nr:MAG: dephospho-CoA kinase [Micavibrio sp.]
MKRKTSTKPTKKIRTDKKAFVIGITGSIGMGKTTVGKMFADLGIPVNNADHDVHEALAPGGAAVAEVGKLVPDALKQDENGQNYIDRTVLAAQVFADLDDLSLLDSLEKILHPVVGKLREDFVAEQAAKGHNIIVCDIPLLFETGLEKDMDMTLCVSAPADVQRQRVLARPFMTEEKLETVLNRQIPDAEKRKKADRVLDTSETQEQTRKKVEKLVQDIRKGAVIPKQSRKSGVRNGHGRG